MASIKNIQSTQSFSPIRDIQNGIIITKDGRYVKLMEFTPINFELRSNTEKEEIIRSFASALRAMPETVQFKTIAKRSDVSKFVDKIIEDYNVEQSRGCRKLQEDQMELIQESSAQGISRRFFLAFEYEQQERFAKAPSFAEIQSSMESQAQRIASAMAQCQNELISLDLNDEYLMEALYSILCRSESTEKTFLEKEFEVISRYASSKTIDFSASNMQVIPVNDFISPSRINSKLNSKYLIIDDVYYMFCYLPSATYPVQSLGGWLSWLINLGEGIDVDVWIHKEDSARTQTKIAYKLRFNKAKMHTMEDTSQDFDDVEDAVESGYYLKNGLSGNEYFCYFSTMLTITASSPQELEWKFREIKSIFSRMTMKIKPCRFLQEAAFLSSIPLASYSKDIWRKSRRNALTKDLASIYPFVSYELCDENGILLGRNHSNGSMVFVDIFDTKKYSNANVAIMGASGSGKTYTLQSMALRMRQKQIQVYIIAPLKGVEFQRACESVDGTYINIAPGSGSSINVMEIRKKDDKHERMISGNLASSNSILQEKIQQLHVFFSLLVKDITVEESQILDEAFLKTYEKFGISSKNKSLYDPSNPTRYRKMPTLGDLQKTLLQMAGDDKYNTGTGQNPAKRLANFLTRYVSGSARSFNQQTNVSLDNKYVVIDVSTMTEELLPIGMFIVLDFIWDKIKENRTQKKCIMIDETWKLVGAGSSSQAAKFVLEIFKTIRGFGGSAICATQDIEDFFALEGGVYGKGIINNSKIKMLLKVDATHEIEALSEALTLTKSEADSLRSMQRGQCILTASSNHVQVEVQASPSEHMLITTTREDLERIANMAKSKEDEEF